jgi:threonine dehydrogenase-like Zn-dependent dehydrogenase
MEEGSVIGHEFVGVVEEAGEGVQDKAVGDRVLGSFLIACGACLDCGDGRFNFCRNRRALGLGPLTGGLDGAQAEYVRVPTADVNLRRLDEDAGDLTDEKVLFGGDVLTTGFYAASLVEAGPGDTVAVIGAGPIGLFTAAALREAGAEVVLLDRDPHRVAFAEGRGHSARLVKEDDPAPLVRDAFHGELAHAAVDAVGSVAALKSSIRCVRDGGRVVVVGVYGVERMELALGRAWLSGLDLRFSGMANIQGHWGDALDAVARGTIDPTRLITHRLL